MKSLLLLLTFIFSTNAYAVTIDDIVGVFKVSSTDIPIKAVFHITKSGPSTADFKMDVKRSPYGKLACQAKGVLNDSGIMSTKTVCKSGLRYEHTVHYYAASNFNNFTIRVHNTLYNETINMLFVRQ